MPLLEVRRRLADVQLTQPDFYVRYREISRGKAERRVRVFRRRRGKRVAGSDPELEEPLTALRAIIHRYRTFDTAYSPCRH